MPLLQGRVPQSVFDAYHAAAKSSGVSMAYYFEALYEQLERSGGLPQVPRPTADPVPLDFDESETRIDAA